MILIAGDFNEKVGKAEEFGTCIGKWTRGHRNDNGQKLFEWCENNNKFLCNTAFQHKQSDIATWSNSVINSNTNKVHRIYNQIDYTIMSKNQIQNMTDARSYSGTETNSDHRIVVTHFQVQWSKLYQKKPKQLCISKFNTEKLKDPLTKELYQQTLTEKLSTLEENKSITLPHIKNAITESAKENLGFKVPSCKKEKSDDQLHQMPLEQKQLRVKIRNTTDIKKIMELKRKRNNILKNMTKRFSKIKEERIDAILHELESVNDDHRMFKAVKKLHQKLSKTLPYIMTKARL